jgi:hypothetical protein
MALSSTPLLAELPTGLFSTIHRPPPLAARILPTSVIIEVMAGSLSLLTMTSQASHPMSLKKAMHLRAMSVPVLLEGAPADNTIFECNSRTTRIGNVSLISDLAPFSSPRKQKSKCNSGNALLECSFRLCCISTPRPRQLCRHQFIERKVGELVFFDLFLRGL